MSSIGNIASGLLHAVLPGSLFPTSSTASTSLRVPAAPFTRQADVGQLSTFGQTVSTLQQLQQSNPAQYQQVTQKIATNLQSAAQTAQSGGDTGAASQLNLLASEFRNASVSGQLPNLQDLASSVGGHHGHAQHFHGFGAAQILQGTAAGNGPSSAGTIIANALSSVGVGP